MAFLLSLFYKNTSRKSISGSGNNGEEMDLVNVPERTYAFSFNRYRLISFINGGYYVNVRYGRSFT